MIPRELTESHKSADTRIRQLGSLKAELRLTLIHDHTATAVERGINYDFDELIDEATDARDVAQGRADDAEQAIKDQRRNERNSTPVIQTQEAA